MSAVISFLYTFSSSFYLEKIGHSTKLLQMVSRSHDVAQRQGFVRNLWGRTPEAHHREYGR